MSSLVVKINFSKKEQLTEKTFGSIKQNIKQYIAENPLVFGKNNKKIFMNFVLKDDC
jgi:hypothetical protein